MSDAIRPRDHGCVVVSIRPTKGEADKHRATGEAGTVVLQKLREVHKVLARAEVATRYTPDGGVHAWFKAPATAPDDGDLWDTRWKAGDMSYATPVEDADTDELAAVLSADLDIARPVALSDWLALAATGAKDVQTDTPETNGAVADYFLNDLGGVLGGARRGKTKRPLSTRPKEDAEGNRVRAAPWEVHQAEGHLARGQTMFRNAAADGFLVPGSVAVGDGRLACFDVDNEDVLDGALAAMAEAFTPVLAYRKPSGEAKAHVWFVAEGDLPNKACLYLGDTHIGDVRGHGAKSAGGYIRFYPGEGAALMGALRAGPHKLVLSPTWRAFVNTTPRRAATASAKATSTKTATNAVASLRGAASGELYSTMLSAVGSAVATGQWNEDTRAEMLDAYKEAGGDKFGAHSIEEVDAAAAGAQGKIESGEWKKREAEPEDVPVIQFKGGQRAPEPDAPRTVGSVVHSHGELAEAWVGQVGDDWLFVPGVDEWRRWQDGSGWTSGRDDDAWLSLHALARVAWRSKNARGKSVECLATAGSETTTTKGLDVAARILSAPADTWDANPWLFGMADGWVFDLESGEARRQRRDDRVTLVGGCAPTGTPDPDSEVGRWLVEKFPVEQERRWVQKFIGYLLSGDASEQLMLWLIGGTNTGKSTFLALVDALMGDYSKPMNATHFASTKLDSATVRDYNLAQCAGARVLTVSEWSKKDPLDEAFFNRLTGGDMVVARPIKAAPVRYRPQFKLLFVSNHLPCRGLTPPVLRRLVSVEMGESHDRPQEPELVKRLTTEGLADFAAWAVEGYRLWREEGLHADRPSPSDDEAAVVERPSVLGLLAKAVARGVLVEGEGLWIEKQDMFTRLSGLLDANDPLAQGHELATSLKDNLRMKWRRGSSAKRGYLGYGPGGVVGSEPVRDSASPY